VSFDSRQLAWLLLETVDQMQGKGTTVRLVVLSDPEVKRKLEPLAAEHELLAAEAYLLERGYIASTNLGLSTGAYTITLAGLRWIAEGLPWPLEAPQTPAADKQNAELRSSTGGSQESVEKSWLQRALEG
jgi:hypothetical protein